MKDNRQCTAIKIINLIFLVFGHVFSFVDIEHIESAWMFCNTQRLWATIFAIIKDEIIFDFLFGCIGCAYVSRVAGIS